MQYIDVHKYKPFWLFKDGATLTLSELAIASGKKMYSN